MNKITIEKVDTEKKKQKTIPKSALKKTKKLDLKGVKDPASYNKFSKKYSIKVFTSKGSKAARKTLRKKIAGMKMDEINTILEKNNVIKNSDVPPEIKKKILEHATSAGFVSL